MKSIANHLRRWRQARGYTQQQMANFLTIHRTTYPKYETNAADPSLETLCRIAALLECTTDTLLGRT